jgi:hypothetical protein
VINEVETIVTNNSTKDLKAYIKSRKNYLVKKLNSLATQSTTKSKVDNNVASIVNSIYTDSHSIIDSIKSYTIIKQDELNRKNADDSANIDSALILSTDDDNVKRLKDFLNQILEYVYNEQLQQP